MAKRTAAILIHTARQAVRPSGSRATDRDLLARFAAGDQAAFELLVARHAGMVLGVCRRVLPTLQDAEDACQATFLILARKAGGRWQPSIANWLYTTARRVADRARRTAARRARREGRAAVPESTPVPDPLTARELLAALDEELERLPAHYREPLVLCYLEGLTRDETAIRLAVPLATVKTRLERGRKRLEAALTRRGLGLGAGLLTAAVVNPAAVASPPLVDSILSAVTGSPSAVVAELARGSVMGQILRISAVAVAGIVAVVGLGYGWTVSGPVPVQAGQSPKPPAVDPAEKKFQADVAAAREKAISYLRGSQQPDGKWNARQMNLVADMEGGITALVALALLEAGVPAEDPAVAKAVKAIATLEPKRTYVVSLQTQVLARVDSKKYADVIQRNADWLVKNAVTIGDKRSVWGWSYGGVPATQSDGSNTHFGVFGLNSAARAGAKVDRKVWEDIRQLYFRTRTNRGWGYVTNSIPDKSCFSMTAAAICGLLVTDLHLMPTEKSKEVFMDGMSILLGSNDQPISIGYNWMVTAELGRLIGSDRFKAGDKEVNWYRDGAQKLVKDQNADGSWTTGKSPIDNDPVLATAFALYFLGPERKQ